MIFPTESRQKAKKLGAGQTVGKISGFGMLRKYHVGADGAANGRAVFFDLVEEYWQGGGSVGEGQGLVVVVDVFALPFGV